VTQVETGLQGEEQDIGVQSAFGAFDGCWEASRRVHQRHWKFWSSNWP